MARLKQAYRKAAGLQDRTQDFKEKDAYSRRGVIRDITGKGNKHATRDELEENAK